MASNQIERSLDREIKSSQFLNSSLSHSRAILPHEFSTISRRNQLFRSIITYQIERSPCSDSKQHFDPTACPHHGCQIEIFTSPYTVRFEHHYHCHPIRHGCYHESCQFYTPLIVTYPEESTIFAMPPMWSKLRY